MGSENAKRVPVLEATTLVSMLAGVLVGLLIADSALPAEQLDLPLPAATISDPSSGHRRCVAGAQGTARDEAPGLRRVPVRRALILIALTAPVAPACSVTPSASRTIPGMVRAPDPSIRMPRRPRR